MCVSVTAVCGCIATRCTVERNQYLSLLTPTNIQVGFIKDTDDFSLLCISMSFKKCSNPCYRIFKKTDQSLRMFASYRKGSLDLHKDVNPQDLLNGNVLKSQRKDWVYNLLKPSKLA